MMPLQVVLDEDDIQTIKDNATERGLSVSAYLRMVIRKALEEEK